MKVLLISDSLGCPIEQRGIHNFSVALVEVLQAFGAKVDLLVERRPTTWLAGRLRSDIVDLEQTRRSLALAEVFRFFAERRYGASWIHRFAERRFHPGFVKRLAGWLYVAYVRLRAGPTIALDNDLRAVDFVPAKGAHLALPNGFVVRPAVYTEMMLRACWGLPPDTIDAADYDLVVIDTPSYFRLANIASARVLAVIHDLIPLRDPTMTPYWRALFFRKLEATLALDPNLAFVSDYSRRIFAESFPAYQARHDFVFYPTLREGAVARACKTGTAAAKPFAPRDVANLEASVALQDRFDRDRPNDFAVDQSASAGARLRRAMQVQDAYVRTGWDSRLPYFATVVSDEARKNIEIFLRAFATLKGRANMVVLGNVDGRRYVGFDPNAEGHIRFTGFISEAEKMRVIAGSAGLIFPSFAEGFGIPLVEGALYEKPVLCSDIEVFREVAGEDAFYFDPYRDDSLVEAIDATLAAPEAARARAARLKARVLQRYTKPAAMSRMRAFLLAAGAMQAPRNVASQANAGVVSTTAG